MKEIYFFKEDSNYQRLKSFVPEVENYDLALVNLIYEKVYKVYKREEDELLRYYYLGYLLTVDDENMQKEDVAISNVTIKGNSNYENPYWVKLNRLLDLYRNDKYGTKRKTKIVIL